MQQPPRKAAMPIFVNCVCGKRLQGRDEDAGRQTRCPHCGKIITLPQESEPEVPPPEPIPSTPETREPAAREFVCRVCQRAFGISEVYSEDGAYVCKRCFNEQEGDLPEEPGGRWDHHNVPSKQR